MKYPDIRYIGKGKEIVSAPPKNGLERELNQKTPMRQSRKQGWMFLTCEVCGIEFEKTAYNAKKVPHHYCSRSCSGISKRRRILCHCKMCGAQMLVIPAMFAKTTTCGDECSKKFKQALEKVENRDGNNQYWTANAMCTPDGASTEL